MLWNTDLKWIVKATEVRVHFPAQKLPVDGNDGSAQPDDDEHDFEDEGPVVALGVVAQAEREHQAEEQWPPQVPWKRFAPANTNLQFRKARAFSARTRRGYITYLSFCQIFLRSRI